MEEFFQYSQSAEFFPYHQSAEFFQYHQFPEQIFWAELEANSPVLKGSAFENYKGKTLETGFGKRNSGNKNCGNVNKRMIGFLRRTWNPVKEMKESERERSYKHMMNERTRREKQKESYSELRSLLPPRTKNEKSTIIQVAAKEIIELQNFKEELERRNEEIENILAEREELNKETAKIRLRVENPSCGIDSMLLVLQSLKNMGCKTRALHSNFSPQELSAVLAFGPEVKAAEVEKFVQRTLFDVERKPHFHIPI